MDTDTLNENVFDMPDDIQEAENRVQRHNQGRRLALVRLLSINNNETVFRSDKQKTDQVLICEAAISTYERDRIMQQEKEIGQLQGEISGLKYQLEQAKAGNMTSEAPRESNDDVNACLRVIRLMVIQNEQLHPRRAVDEADEASRLEDALVSNLRQGLRFPGPMNYGDSNAYQRECLRTAKKTGEPDGGQELCLLALGLSGESGEVADHIKKHVGHGHSLDREKVAKELGDTLWYLAVLSWNMGYQLSDVMAMNVAKLQKRYPNGFSQSDSIARVDEVPAR